MMRIDGVNTMKKFLEWKHVLFVWFEKKIDKLDKRWEKEFKPQIIRIDKTPEYLENRIIYCGNCNRNVTIWRYQGKLVCSTCNSDHWTFPINVRPEINKDILKKVLRPSGKC